MKFSPPADIKLFQDVPHSVLHTSERWCKTCERFITKSTFPCHIFTVSCIIFMRFHVSFSRLQIPFKPTRKLETEANDKFTSFKPSWDCVMFREKHLTWNKTKTVNLAWTWFTLTPVSHLNGTLIFQRKGAKNIFLDFQASFCTATGVIISSNNLSLSLSLWLTVWCKLFSAVSASAQRLKKSMLKLFNQSSFYHRTPKASPKPTEFWSYSFIETQQYVYGVI